MKFIATLKRFMLAVLAVCVIGTSGHAQGLVYGSTPALPRHYINTHPSAQPSNGTVWHVHNGGNLQAVIDSAAAGDKILIDTNAVVSCVCTLPAKVGADSLHWITIATNGVTTVEGTRMDTAQARTMKLATWKNNSRFSEYGITADSNAAFYRISGLILADTTINADSLFYGQVNLQPTTHHIYFDHVYLHGDCTGTQALLKGVGTDGAWEAITDSWLSCITDGPNGTGGHGFQTQTVAGYHGPGPYKIVNNYLESSGENVMFGGADDPSEPVGQNPSDIEIRRNHFKKNLAWIGIHNVDNLFELKNGQRVLIEGNIFENEWTGEQHCAILMQSGSQQGITPWTQVTDVTFRYNHIFNAPCAFGFAAHIRSGPLVGYTEVYNDRPESRVLVENNVFDQIGVDPAGLGAYFTGDLNGAVRDFVFRHNDVIRNDTAYQSAFQLDTAGVAGSVVPSSGLPKGLKINDNVYTMGYYGFATCPEAFQSPGTASLNACASTDSTVAHTAWQVTGNLFFYLPFAPPCTSWGCTTAYPPGNQFPALSTVGFNNYAGGDYTLTTNWRSITTDGLQPGANIAKLNSMLVGVP